MTGQKLDFIVVTYKAELNILRAQAISFSRKVALGAVNKVWIIINDAVLSAADLSEIVELFGPHKPSVTIVLSREIAPNLHSGMHGWWVQQILKLRIAKLIETPYYVVLDSKNHFTKSISSSSFFSNDGLPLTSPISYVNNAEEHCRGSFQYFKLDPDKYISQLPPSITPIVLRTQLVNAMITYVEKTSNRQFEFEFIDNVNLTEFLMYYAFVLFSGLSIEQEYHYTDPLVATLFKDKLRDENTFNSVMWQAEQSSRLMFGVHWAVVPLLETWHRDRIFSLWKMSDIFVSDEEANKWLSTIER